MVGKEGHAHRVLPHGRKRRPHHAAQESIRDLDQHAGTVARIRLGTGGTAMIEIVQGRHRLVDDGVGGDAGQCGDEGNTAGVVLTRGVIQALGRGQRRKEHPCRGDNHRTTPPRRSRSADAEPKTGRHWPVRER